MADHTDGGSPERVAHDLCRALDAAVPPMEGTARVEQLLRLYVACRDAVRNGNVDISDIIT